MEYFTKLLLVYLMILKIKCVSSKYIEASGVVINIYPRESDSVSNEADHFAELMKYEDSLPKEGHEHLNNKRNNDYYKSDSSIADGYWDRIIEYINKPPCRQNEAYCIDKNNEMDADILKYILQMPGVQDKLDLILSNVEEIYDRYGKVPYEPLCKHFISNEYSVWAKTFNNSYEYVLTDLKNNKGIVFVTCENPGGSCNNSHTIFAKRYDTMCKQIYVERTVLTLNKKARNGFELVRESIVQFPSCCQCEIKEVART